jgi:hypothetical protein
MSTPTKERAEQLANMVEKRRRAIESMLMDIKEQRGEDAQLEPGEQARYRQVTEDLRSLQDHAETYAEDLARVGTLPTKLAHSGGATPTPAVGRPTPPPSYAARSARNRGP